ncbi:hypothetical protein D3C73_1309010 [compost metagenome]
MMLSSTLPEPEVHLDLLILTADQKAKGRHSTVEIRVPSMDMANVSNSPRSKSSPSGK